MGFAIAFLPSFASLLQPIKPIHLDLHPHLLFSALVCFSILPKLFYAPLRGTQNVHLEQILGEILFHT
jgi:hypothetical protein